jgi:hypothetical protein
MSTDRDTTRIVRSWLSHDEHESADRVLYAVLDQLDTTPQRRTSWWPARRFPEMNNTAKLALGAAAVVLVSLLGIQFLAPGANVGGPDVRDPSDSGTSAPSLAPRALPRSGELEPGSYVISRQDWTPVPFTFAVPAGWTTDANGFIRKHEGEPGEVMLTPWIVSHVYADACHWDGSLFEVGTTADDMADALSTQLGRDVSGPTDLTLGGHPAKRIQLTVPAELDVATCDEGQIRSWPSSATDETTGWIGNPGQTDVMYVIDVDGERILIGTTRGPEASDENVAQLDAIIASIRITPDSPGN